MNVEQLRARLLGWYRQNRRDLPWRRTRDPYAVWISEVMLQQTRVDTVIPYYERFLKRFPTVAALANADPGEVNAAWSGLGYYRRAKLMMSAAAMIVRDHGAALPPDHAALHALPGFGRYTAGAVASIAFDLPAPAVDGNVIRVLSRIYGIDDADPHKVWAAADALVPGEAPGELNQALIELGALLCAPRSPRCLLCPAASMCSARARGLQEEIPPPKKRAAKKIVELTALLILDARGRVVLEKQPPDGLFGDLWCLPMLEGALEPDGAIDEAGRKYKWTLDQVTEVAQVEHILTHRELHMRVMSAGAFSGTVRAPSMMRAALDALGELGIPSMTVRALKASLPEALLATANLPGRRTRGTRSSAERSRRTDPSTRPSNTPRSRPRSGGARGRRDP